MRAADILQNTYCGWEGHHDIAVIRRDNTTVLRATPRHNMVALVYAALPLPLATQPQEINEPRHAAIVYATESLHTATTPHRCRRDWSGRHNTPRTRLATDK